MLKPRIWRRLTLLTLLVMQTGLASFAQTENALLDRAFQPQFEDLPALRKDRLIRVLVCYSQTNFFINKGRQRGFEYEMISPFADRLNEGITREDHKVQLVFIPVAFDQLLPMLNRGLGEIAAAGLTITEERRREIDFTDPYLHGVDEIVVASSNAPKLQTLDSLSGKEVHVSAVSSYQSHLEEQNARFRERGLQEIKISHLDPKLETEDYLELVSSGIIDYTIADSYVAKLWGEVLTSIQLYSAIKIDEGNEISWAVRKDAPLLREELNRFVKSTKKGTLLGNIFFKRHYENTDWIKNPLTSGEQSKLDRYTSYFKKNADDYGLDWLRLAAQAYQESKLDQGTRSSAGAIGLMQLLPSTAAEMNLDPSDAEQNIQAGARYMAKLIKRFESNANMDAATKVDFALASYNAGPTRVTQWRKKAATQGLNPDLWFDNVEYVAYRETVRYVGNIDKYYIAYRMSQKSGLAAREEMERLIENPNGR